MLSLHSVSLFLTLKKWLSCVMVLVTDSMTSNFFQAAALLCYLAHTYPEGSVKSIISSSLLYWISPKLTRFFRRETFALLLDASLDIPFAAIRLLDIAENEGRFLLPWKFNHNEEKKSLLMIKTLLNFCANIKECWVTVTSKLQNFQKQPPKAFCKKGALKIFANFTAKHLCWSLF